MKKIGVGLSGAGGRMGRAVKSLIRKKNSGFALLASAPAPGFEVWDPKRISGVIDFSGPGLFDEALNWCLKQKKPFVSGTTALSPLQKNRLLRAGKKIPVFYEENMSWGIGQIKRWIKDMSCPSGSVVLWDIHHKHKKDRPSGTALKLKKNFPPAVKKKLRVKSLRKGEEFGTHRIVIQNSRERILLEHRAQGRELFAEGALKALRKLIKKPAGLYSFEELFNGG